MDDPIARALEDFGQADLPRPNLDAVKRRARPQILLRRISLSLVAAGLLVNTPFASDWVAETLSSSRRGQMLPPSATELQSPTPSLTTVAACDVPQWRPTYIPWVRGRQRDGIPPSYLNQAPEVSSATWQRGGGSNDELHMGKLLYSGAGGQPGPSLPDGTSGVLHHNYDDPDHQLLSVGDYVPPWSVIWSTRFPDGCKSLHLVLRMDELSEDELRDELIKVARSLVEHRTPNASKS